MSKPKATKEYYVTDYECYAHLVAAIIQCAQLDAKGNIESSSYARGRAREITIQDGIEFFRDERWIHYAELRGLDPNVLPVGIEEIHAEIEENGYDYNSYAGFLAKNQIESQKRLRAKRVQRKLRESLQRLERKNERDKL